ncbi:hypothetical protein V1264_010504 [Littorina saxatilis]|uniref:Uncharacterized protein n=2 Tax=Littorina saxatilis TaxID=31220 RepID=A0AAN9AQ44_9CAEN
MTPHVTSVSPLTSSVRTASYCPASPQQHQEVMGEYHFDLRDKRTSFHLTTRRNRGRSSLRHCISGLSELDRSGYTEFVLKKVNGENVRELAHTAIVCTLKKHLLSVESTKLTMTVHGTDECGRKQELKVIIELDYIYEDGSGSIGDKARAVYTIIVRVIDRAITTPDVTDVTYQDCRVIRIRHGALVGHFLKVGSDSRLCMAETESISETDAQFKCYQFFGHDQTDSGGGGGRGAGGGRGGGRSGGGDGDDQWPMLCVLQDLRSKSFVEVNAITSRLVTDPDRNHGLGKDIKQITKPDGRFFILIATDKTASKYCLTPLILRKYYLRFDAVDGLKLEKLKKPPYCNPEIKRAYDFEIVPTDMKCKPVTL